MLRKLSVVVAAVAVAACAKSETPATDSTAASATVAAATAMAGGMGSIVMRDAAGHDLGTLMLMEGSGGLSLTGTLRGLPPGTHAIHLHTTGQCVAPFETAGAHWNPTNKEHGAQNPAGMHLGDMTNFLVGPDSTASLSVSTSGGTLRGANALMDADGAAAVVHAGADDYKTDPAGNSGNKIACGTVTGA